MPMEPDWNDLKVVLALARGGSVAGAARELKVDHSTVSRRLAALEEALGAQLLVRGGREFAWTSEGKVVLATAEATEGLVAAAARQLRLARQEVGGTVRVSTTPSMLAVLGPVLPQFQSRYPSLDFEFLASQARVDLAKGAADIAVRFGESSEPDLVQRFVAEAGFALYASKAYVAQHGAPESPGQLGDHRLVLYIEPMHHYGPGLRWLEEHRREGTGITRVDSLQGAEQLLAHGRGIGSLPVYIGDRNSELQRVLPGPIAQARCYLVYHESLRDAARVRAAIEVLAAAIGSIASFMSGRPAGAGCGTTA